MINRLPSATVALGLSMSATAAAVAPPIQVAQLQSHTQRIYRSAAGSECKSVTDGFACVSVVAIEEGDWAGTIAQTRVEITETLHKDTGYEFRNVSCPVDDARLQVSQKAASLSVALNTDLADCTHIGEKVTFDPYSIEPYYFTGTIAVEGSWTHPGNQFKQNGITVQTDNIIGEQHRENCEYFGAWQMLSGGFSIQGEFHPFGTTDSSGDFSSDHCNNLIK